MFNLPLFKQYRISEFVQFFTDVIRICEKNPEATLQVINQLTNLKDSTAKLESSFKIDRASEITEQLKTFDSQRDQAIICLRKFADAFSDYPDVELQSAGTRLLNCIDKYGVRIYKMNYQAETSTLSKLCKELMSDEIKEDVQKLQLTSLVEYLNNSNNSFNDLYLNRVTKDAADDTVSSGEAVKETINDYRALAEHLDAYSVIAPSEQNTKLLSELIVLIDKYNSTVSLRVGQAKEIEETEEVKETGE